MDQNTFGERWGVIINLNCYGLQSENKRTDVFNLFHSANFILFECSNLQNLNESIDQIIFENIRKIISVGGDGSVHFLVNALVAKECNLPDYLITVLPVGTGNDWIRTFGIPSNLSKWKAMLKNGSVETHYLGEATMGDERRIFINILGFGFDSFVVQKLSSWNKRTYGKLIYLLGVLKYLFNYKSTFYELTFDQSKIVEKIFTGHFGLGNFSGGGMKTVPMARYNSGEFALSIIRDYPKWKMFSGIVRLFHGSIHKHSAVDVYHTKEVYISSQNAPLLSIEADGELIGILPAKVKIYNKSINILIP